MNEPIMMSESDEIQRRKAVAKEHFSAIKRNGGLHSKSSLAIGWHAYRLKVEGLFGVLGYATEDEARLAAGVGDSTWYSTISLAEKFAPLTEEQFTSMRLTNAKALADLPDSKRCDLQWIIDAGDKSIKEFQKLVDEEMLGKAKPSEGKERPVVMKISMPESRQAVIVEKAREFAETHNLDTSDAGKAIEIALIEVTEGPTLIGAITTALQRVKEAKAMMRGNMSADEILRCVEGVLDDIVGDFQEALNGTVQQDKAA